MKKIAIIHDWLDKKGGAEIVLEELYNLYPEADLFSLVNFANIEKDLPFLKKTKITTSFIEKLPFAKKHFRKYFFLFSIAIEQFDLNQYDLVISSSYAFAKGVITAPESAHICYIHSPIRYGWDLQFSYLKDAKLEKGLKSILVKYFLHKIRIWDVVSNTRVDKFIVNSSFIKQRVQKFYKRDATVVFPPTDIDYFKPKKDFKKENFYFTTCRHISYKRVDIIIEAFKKMPKKRLLIAGEGEETKKLKKLAENKENIVFLGKVERIKLVEYMQKAKGFIYPALEDFGLVMVESLAAGTPVISYNRGGAKDILNDKVAVFFENQTVDEIIKALKNFETRTFEQKDLLARANLFSRDIFLKRIKEIVNQKINIRKKG